MAKLLKLYLATDLLERWWSFRWTLKHWLKAHQRMHFYHKHYFYEDFCFLVLLNPFLPFPLFAGLPYQPWNIGIIYTVSFIPPHLPLKSLVDLGWSQPPCSEFALLPSSHSLWNKSFFLPPVTGFLNSLTWLFKHGFCVVLSLVCEPSCSMWIHVRWWMGIFLLAVQQIAPLWVINTPWPL